jgi:hypothetical protein
MKVLCNKKTDESLHIFSDSTEVYLKGESLWIKYKEKDDFEIKGYDEKNFIIYQNVDTPYYWLNRTYKYNPEYGWKYIEDYSYHEEWYETYLRIFIHTCDLLVEKNMITEDEYKKLLDFSEIEKFLYHKIDYYRLK